MIWAELIIKLLYFVIRVWAVSRILCSLCAFISSAESTTASLYVFLVGLTASASLYSVAHRCLFCCLFSFEWVCFYDSTNFDSISQQMACSYAYCGLCVFASSSSAIFTYSSEHYTCPKFKWFSICAIGARR